MIARDSGSGPAHRKQSAFCFKGKSGKSHPEERWWLAGARDRGGCPEVRRGLGHILSHTEEARLFMVAVMCSVRVGGASPFNPDH